MKHAPFLAAVAFLLALTALPRAGKAEPTADGLYAGFITSEGSFWIQLEFVKAPRTVGNFVSLAEGTRDFIDLPASKVVRRRFYDGLTFHRVIDKFMIQGGSPNGLGNDGPGYQFADEFQADLKHSSDGILSMANSGLNSNGSQFFVTVTNTPWLDGKHSVFGKVVEGLEVVHKISKVAVTNERPLVPVVIQEVRILRLGTAALAFDPATVNPAPPDVGVVPIAIVPSTGKLELRLQPRAKHILYVFASDDFAAWGYGSTKQTLTNLDVSTFLQGSYLDFPHAWFRALEGGFEP
jgi:peptidyl-prolyl cis-trans isomerase A (cyclophilin A)